MKWFESDFKQQPLALMDMQSLVIFNKHHVKLVELSSFKQIYMTTEKRASSESQNESAEMTF